MFLWLPTGLARALLRSPAVHSRLPMPQLHSETTPESMPSLVLIILLLILLMVDQVLSLRCRSGRSALPTSGSSVDQELIATEEDLSACSLLYIMPEAW